MFLWGKALMGIKLESKGFYENIFSVYAYFEYSSDKKIKFRRFADIVRNDHKEDAIDAYLIMINPGSCSEKSSDNPVKDVKFYRDYKGIVEANCDMAQKCVMALMKECGMNKIRILNLSDYANGNLKEALEKKEYFEKNIFSDENDKKRREYMPTEAVCIAAWGTNKALRKYKEKAYNKLVSIVGEGNIIGFQEKDDKQNYSYRYIKPRRKEEQERVIEKIATKYLEHKSKKS